MKGIETSKEALRRKESESSGSFMSERFATIGNKTVRLSQPYRSTTAELVGRTQETRKILAAWMGDSDSFPLAPLLVGPPGVGKNRLVYEAARLCGKDLYIFQGHEDVTPEDLVCTVRFSDDPDTKMEYILSPLATALMRGVCFVDEIAKMRPRALAPLISLLDERRYVDSTLLGERIDADHGFRFIAATNISDLEDNMLPDFIQSRMRPVIHIGHPGRDEIDEIIRGRFRTLQRGNAGLLERFWRLWEERNGDRPPTPRDSIYIFAYALNLAEYEAKSGSDVCRDGDRGIAPTLTPEHLHEAVEIFHGDREKAHVAQ